jgi:hypothetical protein
MPSSCTSLSTRVSKGDQIGARDHRDEMPAGLAVAVAAASPSSKIHRELAAEPRER